MQQIKLYIALIFMIIGTASIQAQDWPQYLGPARNSTSPQKDILRTWPAGGPEVLWTVSVGNGYGGPVIKDGKVYLLDRDDLIGDKSYTEVYARENNSWKLVAQHSTSILN